VRLRELRGGDPAERKHPLVQARGIGEEAWHLPIVPVTVETVQQLLT
jgi:hypothetical protein